MQRRRDQQTLRTTVLPAPATTGGALPAGPPTDPASPNLTNHGPNRACMKENEPLKEGARRCAGTRSARCSPSSRWFSCRLLRVSTPLASGMYYFQHPQVSQQSSFQRFKPRGKQFKKKSSTNSSDSETLVEAV
ncbi:hypothetical protein F511_31931 [Dorcoceras hygrometricum]|uniref:Uncharacterized protein n=1 Tax=Dorcoceras hygrometricum TaxID=472368 RepID=A0A2Z7CT58_9LAMI|nr:hypothetical protein F511_31931 [Dorcoceras hygrometricum]